MNFRAILLTILVAGGYAAQSKEAAGGGTVTVCLDNVTNDPDIGRAELVAGQILRAASVDLRWRTSREPCEPGDDRAIRIDLLNHAPKNADPLALARSFPYERVHIEVYLDRMWDAEGAVPWLLLAHVFAHEIAHILEGVARHSQTGLMKAYWSSEDYERMRRVLLPFAPEDIALIHEGMAERAAGR